ncbi:glycerol-3-phosphate-acyltransferase [Laetiporus sulphureus 93-53]|uniref:Glycerol-3-phosphate-acyltransferase n=1 Tax=Laetiporus sulphureus 93-53 TaxID=1314785 RepID=A0A165D6Y6_9APHY|nr:glycerol-3-phosphate-acyltransferase [Laetiporus sulphureus 93-53]KZT04264.1 glycerol-3-phosphate-acyltransferase [Laetiporus sulphureus 93-53]
MPNAYFLHRFLRQIAAWALVSFFTEIRIIGGENVPRNGPIIVIATHHNMMIDPAILSTMFPYHRILHFWAKASLFANPIADYVLRSAGNIPVDRKAKDRKKLFLGTFDALSHGHAVAVFPEGTSYTEPRIVQVKDGAAWAALEYAKWAREHPDRVMPGAENVRIVTAAIVYTNKTKYRSNAIMEFGPPMSIDPYLEQFMSIEEGAPRSAVKRLTAALEQKLIETTVNAPDWDTLYAARMARDLLWDNEKSINLDEFVIISQTLVDLFSTPDLVPNFTAIRRHLLTYYSLLQSTHLTNSVLSSLPLPETLDPHRTIPLPSRLFTLTLLIRDTLALLVRLPFFLGPLLLHSPAYLFARFGARLAEDEEETQAQNKVVFGLLLLLLIYPAVFFFVWAFLRYTTFGAVIAAAMVVLFAMYHTKLVNANYERAKRLVSAWRILVGVWMPKRWDLSSTVLAQYTVPHVPPENEWVDRSKVKARRATPTPTPSPSEAEQLPPQLPTARKRRRPPTRRLIRHVLRARVEAAKALASLFAQLDKAEGKRVRASAHLARAYGGVVEENTDTGLVDTAEGVEALLEPVAWRSAREVVAFLRQRGARIAALEDRIEGDWAALSSEGDSDAAVGSERDEDVVWVAPGQSELHH